MEFQVGDRVVHCTYGLGQVVEIKEQVINDHVMLCYEVQVANLSIWVPSDENVNNRLRYPLSAAGLKKLFAILSGQADELPTDRRQRSLQLHEMMKDGKTDSLCRAIRDLAAYKQSHSSWNEYDNEMMKRVENMLIREWGFILSIPPEQASADLHKLLAQKRE